MINNRRRYSMRSSAFPGTIALAAAGLLWTAVLAPTTAQERWWSPGEERVFPASVDYETPTGTLRTLLADGPLKTKGHPFFEAIGPNGRACVTCHQPADAMSLSAASARERWELTAGRDPLFAAYDGSNCPSLPQHERSSHSLLLDYGLIRIQRPWPLATHRASRFQASPKPRRLNWPATTLRGVWPGNKGAT